MTERRPHWDAELCNAVYDAALEAYKDGLNGGAYDIFPIITAVEDWHKAKRDRRDRTHSDECWRWHQECAEYRIEKLSAQVQAVREFCAATNPIRGELHMAALHGWDTAMEMVLQLLESGEIKGFAFRIAAQRAVSALRERAEQAEAAIQRVRDVYEDYFHDRSDLDAVESLEAIRRALDGPQCIATERGLG